MPGAACCITTALRRRGAVSAAMASEVVVGWCGDMVRRDVVRRDVVRGCWYLKIVYTTERSSRD